MPRRRFQFRLRTLMVVVTSVAVACAYVAHEAKIVQNRKALVAAVGKYATLPGWWRSSESPPTLPLIRRWLGDKPVCSMTLPGSLNPSLIDELRQAFPEASISVTPVLRSPPLNSLAAFRIEEPYPQDAADIHHLTFYRLPLIAIA
jgi:hypothetical protein